jgi:signal peptidase II
MMSMKPLLLKLALPLYVLDQATKAAVLWKVDNDAVIPVIPGFFNIVHVYNTGAAFGMLKGANTFFMVLSAVALVVIGFLIRRGSFKDAPSKVGAALLLSGVAGNLTDRVLHGHVVDFLDFILPWYGRWPSFNIADSCICIAAGLFIVSAFLEGRSSQPAKP